MISLYSAAQVYAIDQAAIADGIAGFELMSRAGWAALAHIQTHYPHLKSAAVVCGGGNNGGDGYLVAQLLHRCGIKTRLFWLTPPEQLRHDAALAAQTAATNGVVMAPFDETVSFSAFDLLIDAIFGIGLDRPVTGVAALAIESLNTSGRPIFALDIPSGLQADTGTVLGTAVKADSTLCFIARKVGLFTGQGPTYSGTVALADLGVIPNAAFPPVAYLDGGTDLVSQLSPRLRHAHKGHFGHVLVIGGDDGMGGAALLCGMAAARVGAGLVSIATHPAHAATLLSVQPTLMVKGVSSPSDLDGLLARATVVALGPGLGQGAWGQGLFEKGLSTDLPVVLDADGLNFLATSPGHRNQWVLTPHSGEAGRLLCTQAAQIERDRRSAVAELARQFGGTVLLKGAGTLIQTGDQPPFVLQGGNPGMATGGMGDVLTGVIAGLIAQGFDLPTAARLGAGLHVHAGDLAAQSGERGLLATDLLPYLRQVANP